MLAVKRSAASAAQEISAMLISQDQEGAMPPGFEFCRVAGFKICLFLA